MTNRKSLKRALVASSIALILCFTMLLGTTYAWFTDTVTSAGNIIKSGTLDIEMDWADGTADPATATWQDASQGAIFNYTLWEPGYVQVRHISIKNVGTLALKYSLRIQTTGAVSELADVIDVYFIDPATQVADRTALTDAYLVGTLAEVLAGSITGTEGELLPGEANNPTTANVTIALKMQESAGNEYQDKSIGSEFAIQLLATQLTYESDSFDNQYDADAFYGTAVATYDELQAVLNEGGTAVLQDNITATGNAAIQIPEGKVAVIDLNGYTLTSKDADGGANSMAIRVNRKAHLTLEDSVGTGKVVSSCYGVYVQPGATFVMNGGALEVSGNGRYDYAVVTWNATFVMNGGSITANEGIVPSNYWQNNGEDCPTNSITINAGTITALTNEIDLKDALDTIVVDNR